jgi:hypothetical protein
MKPDFENKKDYFNLNNKKTDVWLILNNQTSVKGLSTY